MATDFLDNGSRSSDAVLPFGIDVLETSNDLTVLALSGELDLATAPLLRTTIERQRVGSLVLDLAGVSFLDSTTIGVLVAAQKRRSANGEPLRLRGVQPAQMQVLEVVGAVEFLNAEPAR